LVTTKAELQLYEALFIARHALGQREAVLKLAVFLLKSRCSTLNQEYVPEKLFSVADGDSIVAL